MLTFEYMEPAGLDKGKLQEARLRLTVKANRKKDDVNMEAARKLLADRFPGSNLFIAKEWFESDEPVMTYRMYAIFWLDKRFRISPWYHSALHLPSWAETQEHIIKAYIELTRHLLATRPESEKLLRKAPQ